MKTISTAIALAILISGIAFLPYSCTDKNIEGTERSVYFDEVNTIIQGNCVGCHNSSNSKESHGYDLRTYDGIMKMVKAGDYKNSELYTIITTAGPDIMPPNPYSTISDDNVNIIALWIKQGATSATSSTNTNPTGSIISYKNDVSPILQGNCVTCHNSNNMSGNVSYSSYSDTQVTAKNGKLYSEINNGTMPLAGKLSSSNIAIIKSWIDQRYLNN